MELADFRERVSELLAARSTFTLATNGSGGIWTCDLYFAADDWNMIFWSDVEARHSRNARSGGTCAATVHVADGDWRSIRGVQFQGTVRAIEAEAERTRALHSYLAKFPFAETLLKQPAAELSSAARSAPYVFEPRYVRYLDNRLGFGTRYAVQLTDGCVVSGPDRE